MNRFGTNFQCSVFAGFQQVQLGFYSFSTGSNVVLRFRNISQRVRLGSFCSFVLFFVVPNGFHGVHGAAGRGYLALSLWGVMVRDGDDGQAAEVGSTCDERRARATRWLDARGGSAVRWRQRHNAARTANCATIR